MSNERPNLFNYATSELSQDAFICWLLAWAGPEHKKTDTRLHKCATEFIKALIKKHGGDQFEIKKIEVIQQQDRIDVLCIVNNEYVILIEDKTSTRDHSGQLQRYVEDTEERYEGKKIFPIYYKTEDQSSYSSLTGKGYEYKHFSRGDMLEVLNVYKGNNGNNTILMDYRNHLQKIEEETNRYEEALENWTWRTCIGFYMQLQKKLVSNRPRVCEKRDYGYWGYVPKGDFWGFWGFKSQNKFKGVEPYLQLQSYGLSEEPGEWKTKLCFKIKVPEKGKRSELRNALHEALMEESDKLQKPKRFGWGETMTVCEYVDYMATKGDGLLDMGKTIKNLKWAEKLLSNTVEKLNKNA